MSDFDLPPAVVDDLGVVRFNGRTAEERLADLDAAIDACITERDRERHREQRELLEIVLREYRRPEDLERIYKLLLPRTLNSIPIARALINAFGIRLNDAKMAIDAACDRAKRGPWRRP